MDKVADDDMIKLTRLIQYTTGDAHDAIRFCALMEGSVGYKRAREILLERFGNNHLVTERLINSLKDGGSFHVKSHRPVAEGSLNLLKKFIMFRP